MNIIQVIAHELSVKTTQVESAIKLLDEGATVPFISEMCRSLQVDINILSAQIDHTHQHQCGVMIVSLGSVESHIERLLKHCETNHIIGEILGYVERIHH